MRFTTLALASGAAAQSSQYLASNPGGAVPAMVQAPSIAGFQNSTIQPSKGGLAVCVSGIVPVQASAMNVKFNYSTPRNQTVVTQTFLDLLSSGSPFMKEVMGSMEKVHGTYDIMATYCTPANDTRPSSVQVLTHGVGFDRTYWDFAPGYSYADVAVQNNHAVFFYDRLGVGQSAKPDGLSVVQATLELEILHQLIGKLKSGAISNTTFSSIVGVGHSFGSILTEGLTAKYPSDLNTAILTGFSMNTTGMNPFMAGLSLRIAAQNEPYRFSELESSYLVAADATAVQFGFFHAQNFDPAVLNIAAATKGSVTLGELFATSSVVMPASNFTGAVAIVDGNNDLPFCAGNCTLLAKAIPSGLSMLYPKASGTATHFVPNTGHGINLHYSAVAAYTYIQSFIANHTAC